MSPLLEGRPLPVWWRGKAFEEVTIDLFSEGSNLGKGTEPGVMKNKDSKRQTMLWEG